MPGRLLFFCAQLPFSGSGPRLSEIIVERLRYNLPDNITGGSVLTFRPALDQRQQVLRNPEGYSFVAYVSRHNLTL